MLSALLAQAQCPNPRLSPPPPHSITGNTDLRKPSAASMASRLRSIYSSNSITMFLFLIIKIFTLLSITNTAND